MRVRSGGATTTSAGAFDHAGEPRAAADAIVFTVWLEADPLGDTDVLLYDPAAGRLVPIATGPGQQRFADVSETHVAYTDFAEDPDGRFDDDGSDAADVVAVDRATGEERRREKEGKQAFPMLAGGGRLGFLDWGLVHPELKRSAYDVVIGPLDGPSSSDEVLAKVVTKGPCVRPAARRPR